MLSRDHLVSGMERTTAARFAIAGSLVAATHFIRGQRRGQDDASPLRGLASYSYRF